MKKYAQIIDNKTKLCSVGIGTNTDFYKSIGMKLLDVEQAYNGQWYLRGYAPEKTLDELKEKKLDELTAAGHQFDNQLVNENMIINSALGFKANADLRSQNNINGLIAAGQEPVAYVYSQNAVHTLTLAQLNTLLAECIENGQYLYQQKWAYRAKINACTTKEELAAITFDFKMKDFANE